MDLEDKVEASAQINLQDRANYELNSKNGVRSDRITNMVYYTLTYGLQELIAGKTWMKIAINRSIGLVVQAALSPTVTRRRKHYAQKDNVVKNSPFIDKLKVNIQAITPVQSLAYAGMLFAEMMITNEYDLEKSFYAWLMGTGLSALHAFPAGYFQDQIRIIRGLEPAIKKN